MRNILAPVILGLGLTLGNGVSASEQFEAPPAHEFEPGSKDLQRLCERTSNKTGAIMDDGSNPCEKPPNKGEDLLLYLGITSLILGMGTGIAAWNRRKKSITEHGDTQVYKYDTRPIGDEADFRNSGPETKVGDNEIPWDFVGFNVAIPPQFNPDPIGEADNMLGYGRDKNAVEVLEDALEDPYFDKLPIHIKLLQIYHKIKDTIKYENTFILIKDEYINRIGENMLSKMKENGRSIDPMNPIYQDFPDTENTLKDTRVPTGIQQGLEGDTLPGIGRTEDGDGINGTGGIDVGHSEGNNPSGATLSSKGDIGQQLGDTDGLPKEVIEGETSKMWLDTTPMNLGDRETTEEQKDTLWSKKPKDLSAMLEPVTLQSLQALFGENGQPTDGGIIVPPVLNTHQTALGVVHGNLPHSTILEKVLSGEHKGKYRYRISESTEDFYMEGQEITQRLNTFINEYNHYCRLQVIRAETTRIQKGWGSKSALES